MKAPVRQHIRVSFLFVALVAVAIGTRPTVLLAQDSKPSGPVGPELTTLLDEYEAYIEAGSSGEFVPTNPEIRLRGTLVLVDATASSTGDELKSALAGLGLEDASTFGLLVSGWLPIEAIAQLDNVSDLSQIKASMMATTDRETPDNPLLIDSGSVFPNPFRSTATIRYPVAAEGHVRLTVHDLLGREVARVVDDYETVGWHDATFEADGLAPGLYLYRISVPGRTITSTMTIVR
ncbi:MAG: T9SS type A sorting domain-containing protein [Bacteroidetes bacterium]|nr:T9SS type A sorting domain-containing protein [Bacteroidota bacterium]